MLRLVIVPWLDDHGSIRIDLPKFIILGRVSHRTTITLTSEPPQSQDHLAKKTPSDASVHEVHVSARVLPFRVCRNIALMKMMYGRAQSKEAKLEHRSSYDIKITSGEVRNLPIPQLRSGWFHKGPARWLNLPKLLKNLDT